MVAKAPLSSSIVHYTLDGSAPTKEKSSFKSSKPFAIQQTTRFRARAFVGEAFSDLTEATYTFPTSWLGAGELHSILLQSRAVWTWGGNASGQIGNGTNVVATSLLRQQSLDGAVSVSAGKAHTLVISKDARVLAWGANDKNQLGDNTTQNSPNPKEVGLNGAGLTNVKAIAAGYEHSTAIKTDGSVWFWGETPISSAKVPTKVAGITAAAEVAAGNGFTLIRRANGSVWAFGAGANGQLGAAKRENGSAKPVLVAKLTGITRIGRRTDSFTG